MSVPPLHPDPASDHHLTSDAYTDDSDADSEDDDNGHHPDFDDVLIDPIITRIDPPVPAVEERSIVNHIAVTNTIAPVPVIEVDSPSLPVIEVDIPVLEPVIEIDTINIPQPVIEVDNPVIEPQNNNNIIPEKEERTAEKEERTAEKEERTTAEKEERTRPSGLRPKKPVSYSHRYAFTQTSTVPIDNTSITQTWKNIDSMPAPTQSADTHSPTQMQNIHKAIVGLMFTQMSAHKGIKKHGRLAIDALRKEFLQFKALDVLEPLDAFTLTDEQKSESLRALSVIKEKSDGTIKGRTCADGSSQQGKFSKAETGSPTISNDALFLSIMIDAHEERDVATADVAGAYLHALMKAFITMRFVGWAVDLLCEVNPEYTKYVVYEGKTKVLYCRCNKAIYGCVVSGVLWYELFTETLEGLGFTTNPYDFCIANAVIEGSQCTIGWFVDDTKISHIKPTVVTSIVEHLERKFGKMKVTRGRCHKFLGMNIKYLGDGTATVHMPSYISEAISESGFDVTKPVSTPCANSLLFIDDTSPLLL